MRFAILTAVSKASQATEDKTSLSEQENKCRAVGVSKDWLETAGPYVIPGESRTKYTNLRDAEFEIPALRLMLEEAKQNKFDILMLWDFNRLRDLLDQVAKTLAAYNVQLYSINQPVDPIPSEEFNPYASDSDSMVRGMSQIISRWQISDLRRKYRFGVAGRVNSGITSLRLPYGYTKPPGRELDKNAVAVQVSAYARIVTEIKNEFLAGKSYYDIRDALNARGVPSPQNGKLGWSHSAIKKILINPFYAGKVFFGLTRTVRDPHHNTTRLVVNPNPLIKPGKHTALFTEEEYQAILIEVKRREGLPHRKRYHFAGLLICSVCGAHLVHDHGVWRCKRRDGKPIKDHIGLRVEEALALIPRELQKALQKQAPGMSPLVSTSIKTPALELQELERQRQRVQEGFEKEIYSDLEAERRIKAINAQIQALHNEEANQARRQAQRQQFLSSYEQAKAILAYLPQWVKDEDSRAVNTLLLRLCREIMVTPEGSFTIYFRE